MFLCLNEYEQNMPIMWTRHQNRKFSQPLQYCLQANFQNQSAKQENQWKESEGLQQVSQNQQ